MMTNGTVSVAAAGTSLDSARAAVVMLHGRGATAQDILSLAGELGQDDVAYLAPQAPGQTWYPRSFLAPLDENEPYLSRSLATVAAILDHINKQGFAADHVVLVGFSQGGCLALEFAARNARRYAGVAGLSAGLIGPPGVPRSYRGTLSGTPIFLGCSDIDPHIPLDRVQESRKVLGAMGAVVTERIYPGMGHTISQDEIARVGGLLRGVERARVA